MVSPPVLPASACATASIPMLVILMEVGGRRWERADVSSATMRRITTQEERRKEKGDELRTWRGETQEEGEKIRQVAQTDKISITGWQ